MKTHPAMKQNTEPTPVLLQPDLKGCLPVVAEGKVRVIYELDDEKLFFVATDRISANDVVMKNVWALYLFFFPSCSFLSRFWI